MSIMLSLRKCSLASTGENIFNILDNELVGHKIPWHNCLCFAADNASVMTWKVKGVAAFLTKKAPAVYLLGCACHLIHLAAGKAEHSQELLRTAKPATYKHHHTQVSASTVSAPLDSLSQ